MDFIPVAAYRWLGAVAQGCCNMFGSIYYFYMERPSKRLYSSVGDTVIFSILYNLALWFQLDLAGWTHGDNCKQCSNWNYLDYCDNW